MKTKPEASVENRSSHEASRLQVKDLNVTYTQSQQAVDALRHVHLSLDAGHTLGVVGETGSGKSSLGLAIMGLLPSGARATGDVLLDNDNLLTYSERHMRALRGKVIGMVFQDSLSALNPVFTVGEQIVDTIRRHDKSVGRRDARERAGDLLEELAIPRSRLRSYPHQFSGGMRQRVAIAAALSANPTFLIADESTSELDSVSQRQVLAILTKIQASRDLGLIVISHDLAVVHHMCTDVAVLYRGSLVEYGNRGDVFANPRHWYTRALLAVSARKRSAEGHFITMKRAEPDGTDG